MSPYQPRKDDMQERVCGRWTFCYHVFVVVYSLIFLLKILFEHAGHLTPLKLVAFYQTFKTRVAGCKMLGIACGRRLGQAVP